MNTALYLHTMKSKYTKHYCAALILPANLFSLKKKKMKNCYIVK